MQAILLKLLGPLRGLLPRHTATSKLLHRRSQLSLHQREIIHASNTQDTHSGERRANTIHQRTARATEVVGHGILLSRFFVKYRVRLAPALEIFAATKVLEVRVVDGEVSRVDGGGELVTVGAVANEGADKFGAVSWLERRWC